MERGRRDWHNKMCKERVIGGKGEGYRNKKILGERKRREGEIGRERTG